MGLDEIRDSSRAAIHEAFTVAAVVRSPDGLTAIPVGARLHRDLKKPLGDLDREGFALVMEFYNQVIFDTQQWVPKKNWVVDFDRGRVFQIVNIIPESGERFRRTEVTSKSP